MNTVCDDYFQAIVDKMSNASMEGNNKAKGCCPAHDDSTPSCDVVKFDSGVISAKCWAGCSADSLARAFQVSKYKEGNGGCLVIPPDGVTSEVKEPLLTLDRLAEE